MGDRRDLIAIHDTGAGCPLHDVGRRLRRRL